MARQLGREWEEKLEAHRKLQEDYRRFVREQPRSLSALEREGILRLAQDIPALWHPEYDYGGSQGDSAPGRRESRR